MKFLYVILCVFLLTNMMLGNSIYAATIKSTTPSSNELKWVDARELPRGAKYAIVTGNPKKNEFYVAYLKLPANYLVPLHFHKQNEADTVISGAYYFGTGNKVDREKSTKLAIGSFVFFPSYLKHYGWTEKETILQISGVGPWGTVLVKESV